MDRTLYQCLSEPDLQAGGWRFLPTDKDRAETEYVPSEGAYASKGGRLEGPPISCVNDPFAFYRLGFESRFGEQGYYAVLFRDAAGSDLVDDIYGGVDRSTRWQEQEYYFRGREGACTFRLQFISHGALGVRNVVVETAQPSAVCQWADRFYGVLPPLQYTPSQKRWQHLPRTMDRLHRGGVLHVVMLGDSIVNDTNNSNWDALVGRWYPRCRIQVLTSVRGSTGCWYYREPAHLNTYVLSRRPDLLMIGGISHRQDLDAIREVIRQTREVINCEILLMSGPMGADWRADQPTMTGEALDQVAYIGDPFNTQLAALAEDMGVEFLDMNDIWHRYLGASGKPWRWFHRDAVHANDRGKQILARVLERYFKPVQM